MRYATKNLTCASLQPGSHTCCPDSITDARDDGEGRVGGESRFQGPVHVPYVSDSEPWADFHFQGSVENQISAAKMDLGWSGFDHGGHLRVN